MKKVYTIKGNYSEQEKEVFESLIELFRLSVCDDDPNKNILNKKAHEYTDERIIALLKRAMHDINGGFPTTSYSIYEFATQWDNTLIVDGAIVFALIGEGILQLRNQVNFNDSGLSIGMFDKTQLYQSWVSMLLQQYMQAKQEFKAAVTAKLQPSMFVGIGSEFSYNYPWGY